MLTRNGLRSQKLPASCLHTFQLRSPPRSRKAFPSSRGRRWGTRWSTSSLSCKKPSSVSCSVRVSDTLCRYRDGKKGSETFRRPSETGRYITSHKSRVDFENNSWNRLRTCESRNLALDYFSMSVCSPSLMAKESSRLIRTDMGREPSYSYVPYSTEENLIYSPVAASSTD